MTTAVIFCLGLAFVAEEMGVAAIIGAYFAGVVFATTHHRNRVSHEIQKIAYILFTPIFFMNIGLSVNLENVGQSLGISAVLIFVAIAGKIIGSGLGAKLSKFSNRESLQVGVGMIPRAEVTLIIANLGRGMGFVNNDIFTSIILVVLTTTVVTPPLLKLAFKSELDKEIKTINEC